MIECPVCGYNPDPPEVTASTAQLERMRIERILYRNAQQHWWLTQPKAVLKWLSTRIPILKSILDVGCGDGRWYPAILEYYPQAHYIGIDRMEDHYKNNIENIPESYSVNWILGDIQNSKVEGPIELALIAGTFNPLMHPPYQDAMMSKLVSIAPQHVLCLFDLNQTGNPPDQWLTDYEKVDEFEVPRGEQSINQNLVVWLWRRK